MIYNDLKYGIFILFLMQLIAHLLKFEILS